MCISDRQNDNAGIAYGRDDRLDRLLDGLLMFGDGLAIRAVVCAVVQADGTQSVRIGLSDPQAPRGVRH